MARPVRSPLAASGIVALSLAACAPPIQLSVPPNLHSEDWSRPTDVAIPLLRASENGTLASLIGGPDLKLLSDRAQANSPDIAIAAARLTQARARLGGARAASLPDVSAAVGLNQQIGRQGASQLDFGTALARLDVSWDPDLFGRLRAETRAGVARVDAAAWERKQVALGIEVEVARAWVQRAVLARQIKILDKQILRAAELERIVRVRFDAGDATRVDLGLQSIRLLDLRRDRTRIVQSLDETRTVLATLVGEEAPLFRLPEPDIDDLVTPVIAPLPPAILLSARPDVRAAEMLIAAANGDVQAARASFFPSIRLNLAGLAEAVTSGPLLKTVTMGSELLAPIFARGALSRDLRVAEAEQVVTVENYRSTLLAALAQVEDLMKAAEAAKERAQLVGNIIAEAEITARLGNAQYLGGEEDLRTLIDAEELLGDAEEASVLVRQEMLFAQIGLYQASGGAARAPERGAPMP